MASKREMSLLPESENPVSTSAKITKWLTTAGRFVVVFTELIVILAFISRFWLDRRNADLSEVLRQRRAILESTQPFEIEYKQLQNQLSYIKNFYNSQPDYKYHLNSLVESTPPDIIFNKLSVSYDSKSKVVSANLTLSAFQESAIVDCVTNLILNPNIEKVSIDSIEKKSKETKFSVLVSLQFKQKSGA